MELVIQLKTKDSSILLKIGVNEIGRRSLLSCVGGLTLGTAQTVADFHTGGMYPSWMDELKIAAKGGAIRLEQLR